MSNQETQTGAAAAAILLRSAPLEEQRHFGKLEREEEGEEGADGHGMGESHNKVFRHYDLSKT